jgi:signal transduction histidine kinase
MHSYTKYYKLTIFVFFCFTTLLTPLFGQKGGNIVQKKIAQGDKNANTKIELLIQSARNEPNSAKSIEYYEKAIDLADSVGNENLKAQALFKSALLWKKRGEFFKTIERLNSAIEIFKKNGNQKHEHLLLIDLADTYRNCGEYNEANQMLDLALNYFKKFKNDNALARIGNRKAAIIFEKFFNHNSYINIYSKGEKNHQNLMDTLKNYPELQMMYTEIMNWLIFSNKIANQFDYNNIIISNLNILGSLMMTTFDFQRGLEIYNEAIADCQIYNIEDELPLLLINKARILGVQELNQSKLAIQIAEEGLALAQKQQELIYIFMAITVLEKNYAATGNYEKAYHFLSYKHNLFRNFNNENLNINLKIRSFESKIKDREQEIQNRKSKLKMTYIYSSLLIAIFLGFTIILFLKNRKKKLLNIELHEKTAIISSQIHELQLLNIEKDRLISIIGHDLRTPFNSILGFGELLHEEFEVLSKEEIHLYSGYIIQSSNNTLQLLENLLLWAKIQKDRIVFFTKNILFNDIISDVSRTLHNNLQNKEIQLLYHFDDSIIVHADEEMLKTVVRNLVGNAIKFSSQGGIIEISVQDSDQEYKILVKDYGSGIKKQMIDNIFDVEANVVNSENSVGNGHGLGLILCKEIVEKHGGTIGVESEEGKGSTFYFSLPKR